MPIALGNGFKHSGGSLSEIEFTDGSGHMARFRGLGMQVMIIDEFAKARELGTRQMTRVGPEVDSPHVDTVARTEEAAEPFSVTWVGVARHQVDSVEHVMIGDLNDDGFGDIIVGGPAAALASWPLTAKRWFRMAM